MMAATHDDWDALVGTAEEKHFRYEGLGKCFETSISTREYAPTVDLRPRSVPSTSEGLSAAWTSWISMLSALLVGFAAALSLHLFYSSLDGEKVRNVAQQQNNLRLGTALAFLGQIFFVVSVRQSQTQSLWRGLKRNTLSIRAIDAGFAADKSLLPFMNFEMLTKLRMASLVAIIAWLIPISSLVVPATLSVESVMRSNNSIISIPTLQISKPEQSHNFAVSAPIQDSPSGLAFEGPRSFLTRLAVATATTGEVLLLQPPSTNATYDQKFEGPYVQCQEATTAMSHQIDSNLQLFQQQLPSSVKPISVDYFAFVPALGDSRQALPTETVFRANLSDVTGSLNASNQLWIRLLRRNQTRTAANITAIVQPHYLSCQLYNATYSVKFSWINGIQSLRILDRQIGVPIEYPGPDDSRVDSVAMAYSAFMLAMSDQLTGSMGFFQNVNTTALPYSRISTKIATTTLIGSSDFDNYFLANHALGAQPPPNEQFSAQRLQDMAFARHRTLDALIEELSSNITLSLISNPLMSPATPTNVTSSHLVNIYSYHPRNVFITYAIVFTFAILANGLGLFAYRNNGVSHDNSFSSIVCTTRDVHLSDLNIHERLGALPLDEKVANTRLRFGGEGGKGEGKGGGRTQGFAVA